MSQNKQTGSRKKPTPLKILQGTTRADRQNPDEPMPDPSIPEPPKHLNDEALAEWNRISKELFKLGLLSEIDRSALAAYCVVWSRWVEAETRLKQEPLIIVSKNEQPYQNPALGIANKALEKMRSFLIEFGMTPSSRSKVIASKREEKKQDNPFEKFG